MPRNVAGENLQDYQDLVDKYGTLYGGRIYLAKTRTGRYQAAGGQFISHEEAERIRQYNQLANPENPSGVLEEREPERLDPTPTFFPDLIGPPWPGADRRGPRTKWAEYDRDLQRVTMEFRNGDIYRYMDVPPQVWDTLQSQVSTGQYINSVLNNYPYQKIRSGI